MRQLFPEAVADPDVGALYAYPDPDLKGPPWVRANMVESVDGAASVDGRSGGLSGDADRQVFRILRSLADVVLVGSGTVQAEHYRPAQQSAMIPALRAGRTPAPPIAVVSGQLNLDLSASLYTDAPADTRTIVITTEKAPPDRRQAAAEVADVIIAGIEQVDLSAAVSLLARRGLPRILCEGGPHLLAQLAAAGQLNELCVTVSPVLGAGDAGRILTGRALIGPAQSGGLSLSLGHVLEDQGFLLCRYVAQPAA